MPDTLNNPPITTEENKENETDEQVQSSKQELATAKTETEQEIKNEARLTFSQGLWLQTSGEAFSATRVQGGGNFFKGGKLETNIYTQLDLINGKQPSGFLRANKAIYKGVNLDGIYQYTSTGNEKTRVGFTYRGRTENGGYAFGVFPLTKAGKKFWPTAELYVSLNRQIGENGKASTWALVDPKGKAFWGEAEYVHDFTKNLSAFAQARYGWTFKDPTISGVAGVRLTIK